MRGRSPEGLVPRYRIPHVSMLYRHLHAVGLFDQRNGSFARKFESLLRRSGRESGLTETLIENSTIRNSRNSLKTKPHENF